VATVSDNADLDAATVVSWFRQAKGRSSRPLPTEQQAALLVEFLCRARAGDSSRLQPYKNVESMPAFTNALFALEKAATDALNQTTINASRAAEEIPKYSAYSDLLASKFANDSGQIKELLFVVQQSRRRFPPRRHINRQANWHEGARAVYLEIARVYNNIGHNRVSVNKATSPMISVIVRALAFIEGHERSPDQIVSALRSHKRRKSRLPRPKRVATTAE
jgi:hypothetical protein